MLGFGPDEQAFHISFGDVLDPALDATGLGLESKRRACHRFACSGGCSGGR